MAKNLILAFLLGAVVAGGTTYAVMGAAGTASEDDLPRTERGDAPIADALVSAPPGDTMEVDPSLEGASSATERLLETEQDNAKLKAEIVQLEERIEELTPKPLDPSAFRFGLPEKVPSFDQADWTNLSTTMLDLAELLPWYRDLLLGKEEMDSTKIQAIRAKNGPLAAFALKFGDEIPGDNPNGAFTHPAVFANLIRSALQERGDPLTREQEIAIRTLGDAWVRDVARAIQSLPAGAPELARTVAEVDEKLRFLEAVKRTVLTLEQKGLLFSEETEGRFQLDLLSPALVYLAASTPLEAAGLEDMQTKLVQTLFGHAGVTLAPEVLPDYAWVGRQWVDDIPGATEPQLAQSFEFRFPHIDRVQERARAQVAAMSSVLASGDLSEEEADLIRQVNTLIYPYVLVGAVAAD